MFETQSPDEWLPMWLQSWKPFLVSLLITPFAFIVGASDFGPEGPQVYLGYLLFPYSTALFFIAALLDAPAVFWLCILALLLQFPFYGFVISLAENHRLALIRILFAHLGAILLAILALLILLTTLPPLAE